MACLKKWQRFVLGSMTVLSITVNHGQASLPFQFGNTDTDIQTSSLDDAASVRFTLAQPFSFKGDKKTGFYQNSNGVITFEEAFTAFRTTGPFPSNNLPDLVALYWTDIDTRSGGSDTNRLFARNMTQQADLQTAQEIIQGRGLDPDFVPTNTAVITYERVNRFDMDTSVENTFQLAFAYNITDTWVILAYSQLEFFNASSSADFTIVGFNGNIVVQGLDLVQNISSTEDMLNLLNNSNCNQKGVYAYRLAKGPVVPLRWIDITLRKIEACADNIFGGNFR